MHISSIPLYAFHGLIADKHMHIKAVTDELRICFVRLEERKPTDVLLKATTTSPSRLPRQHWILRVGPVLSSGFSIIRSRPKRHTVLGVVPEFWPSCAAGCCQLMARQGDSFQYHRRPVCANFIVNVQFIGRLKRLDMCSYDVTQWRIAMSIYLSRPAPRDLSAAKCARMLPADTYHISRQLIIVCALRDVHQKQNRSIRLSAGNATGSEDKVALQLAGNMMIKHHNHITAIS